MSNKIEHIICQVIALKNLEKSRIPKQLLQFVEISEVSWFSIKTEIPIQNVTEHYNNNNNNNNIEHNNNTNNTNNNNNTEVVLTNSPDLCSSLKNESAILDLSSTEQYNTLHLANTTHFPFDPKKLAQSEDLLFQLPPKGTELVLVINSQHVANDFYLLQQAITFFYLHRYPVNLAVALSDHARNLLRTNNSLTWETGPKSKRLWQPNQFLLDNYEIIAKARPAQGKGLDLASGSGRDAVFLAEQKWEMVCVDNQLHLLENSSKLAVLNRCQIETKILDLEKNDQSQVLNLLGGENVYGLIHVCRYLHRPLFETIKKALRPGGLCVYSTFMEGCQNVGACRPKNPKFILKKNELKEIFDPKDFNHLLYQEIAIEDGRPVQCIIAQKKNI